MQVQQTFKDDQQVLLLSHSVTPEKDNVAVLKEYAYEHGAIKNKWHFVTGNRNDIYNIARKAYFADEDMGWKQDSTTFLHTENILLIDKHHHIRGVYKGTIQLQVNDLINDIKELETEE
jgi:protein SCO1/2